MFPGWRSEVACACVFLLALIPIPSFVYAQPQVDCLREIKADLAQGFFDDVILKCYQALSMDPRNPETYYYLAIAYSKKGDFAQPLRYYQRAIERNPQDPLLLCELGLVWQLKGEDGRALEYYRKALMLDPRCIVAYHALAEIYGKKGDYRRDIIYSRRALALNPSDVDVYYVFRIPYVQKVIYEEAKKNFLKAIELDPGFIKAYWALGEFYSKIAKIYSNEAHYDHAIKCWYRIIQLNPAEPGAYFILGVTFREKGMTAKARAFLQKAIQLKYYDIFGAYANLKDVYSQEGREENFIRYLKKVLKRNPGDTEARYFLAEMYLCGGKTDEANAQAEELRRYARHDLADRLKGLRHATP